MDNNKNTICIYENAFHKGWFKIELKSSSALKEERVSPYPQHRMLFSAPSNYADSSEHFSCHDIYDSLIKNGLLKETLRHGCWVEIPLASLVVAIENQRHRPQGG